MARTAASPNLLLIPLCATLGCVSQELEGASASEAIESSELFAQEATQSDVEPGGVKGLTEGELPADFTALSDWDLISRIDTLSDQELRLVLEQWGGFQMRADLGDACVLEMVRRGGSDWDQYLRQVLARLPDEGRFYIDQFEILTALRRLNGKPDPLIVRVENGPHFRAVFPELPEILVRLQNVDEVPITITDGGHTRSGRFARVRFDVRDSEGNMVRLLPPPSSRGGGLSTTRTLQPGEIWGGSRRSPFPLPFEGENDLPVPLPLGYYVEAPQSPGEYTVVVQYHNQRSIDTELHVSGLIVSRSEPVRLSWEAREMKLPAAERREIVRLLQELYEDTPVHLIWTPYSDDLEFEGDEESAFVQIFSRGFQTLPVLLDELQRDRDLHHRAWLLAMLTNITGLNRPDRWDRVFGEYSTGRGHYFYPYPIPRTLDDRGPEEADQEKLIAVWQRYRSMIKVVE